MFAGWLAGWMAGWLYCLLACLFVCLLACWLAGWLAGLQASLPACLLACLPARPPARPAARPPACLHPCTAAVLTFQLPACLCADLLGAGLLRRLLVKPFGLTAVGWRHIALHRPCTSHSLSFPPSPPPAHCMSAHSTTWAPSELACWTPSRLVSRPTKQATLEASSQAAAQTIRQESQPTNERNNGQRTREQGPSRRASEPMKVIAQR